MALVAKWLERADYLSKGIGRACVHGMYVCMYVHCMNSSWITIEKIRLCIANIVGMNGLLFYFYSK